MATIPKKRRKAKAIPKKGRNDVLLRDRARLDKKRLARDRSSHLSHFWDVCPKCGGDMDARTAQHVHYDVCKSCGGIYIDEAELKFAGKHTDPRALLRSMASKKKPPVRS